MRRELLVGMGTLAVAVTACGGSAQSSPQPTPDNTVTVRLLDAQGAEVAKVVLTPAQLSQLAYPGTSSSAVGTSAGSGAGGSTPATEGVRFSVNVERLLPGSHAFAIHAVGSCDPPRFTTAGQVFSAPGVQSRLGPQAGSLPDIPVGSDGTASAQFASDAVTLERGPANSLRSDRGTSLVLLDSVGNTRIACGVISAPSPSSASPSPSPTPTVSTSTTTTTVTVTHTSTTVVTPSPSPAAATPTPTP